MRTIHFAHWAFVSNGSRLMFFSNFDHNWESYLDDFIKAHGGLTLAWGSCVGFPPTRFLVLDGASHGRQFKAWARHSMAVSRFWFSAYKDYTVDQIERHARIANGLRKPTLTPKARLAFSGPEPRASDSHSVPRRLKLTMPARRFAGVMGSRWERVLGEASGRTYPARGEPNGARVDARRAATGFGAA